MPPGMRSGSVPLIQAVSWWDTAIVSIAGCRLKRITDLTGTRNSSLFRQDLPVFVLTFIRQPAACW